MATGYTDLEKLIAAASKAWRYLEWTMSDDFAEHEQERRVVIADGEYTGRPAVPISVQQKRAREDWSDKLYALRESEREDGGEYISEQEIKDFVEQRHAGKGRKRGGRALALQKYIRRIVRQIGDTEEAPDKDFDGIAGPGRPKMSRKQKIKHFQNLVAKAKKELEAIYEEMPERDKLWHQLHDLKSDRRQLRLALKSPENPQSTSVWKEHETREAIRGELDSVCAEIARRDARIAMLDAGITPNDDQEEQPQNLEEYRRALELMVKEQKKIRALEAEAESLGIDVSRLKR
jgi:hypothetical protein